MSFAILMPLEINRSDCISLESAQLLLKKSGGQGTDSTFKRNYSFQKYVFYFMHSRPKKYTHMLLKWGYIERVKFIFQLRLFI